MTSPAAPALIRQWAREQGIRVGVRGRLSPALLSAYGSAHDSELAATNGEGGGAPLASRRDGGLRVAPRPSVAAAGSVRRIVARPWPGSTA